MNTGELKKLLVDELNDLNLAYQSLNFSYERCLAIEDKDKFSEEELEKIDSLTSRFARVSDLLIQKIFRLIEAIDLDNPGSVRDRILRAEKKGLISNAEKFVRIRELRNLIAHEYEASAIKDIKNEVLSLIPEILDSIEKINEQYKS